ncbi:MAG TPA: NDP-sugar synthase [bacterium]|nr:NDP-sugar synthase [bacterium]
MKAIILVGGQGTRLRPLTDHLPKNIVPLCGAPFLHYPLRQLKKAGIREVAFSVGYKSQAIRKVYGDGRKLGMRFHYALEKEPLGTGGAIKNAERFVKGHPVVVLNGDILTDLPLSKMIAFHRKKRSAATLGLVRVEDPTAYGLVLLDRQKRVTRFLEKPTAKEAVTDTINAGVYLFEPQVFGFLPAGIQYSAERGLFPDLLASRTPFFGYVWDGYWPDIGTPRKYLTTHWDILKGAFTPPAPFRKKGGVHWGKGVKLGQGARVMGPAMLGDGCVLGAGARVGPLTVLGRGCRIGEGAVVEKSVLWDGASVGPGVRVKECLLGRRARVVSPPEPGLVLGDSVRR